MSDIVYTLELDPGDETGVLGTRHAACIERTDVGHCTVLTEPPDTPPEDNECWGCDGWLNRPPLTVKETAELHRLREQE